MDVVQLLRQGGSFRIRRDADATSSILGAAAAVPAVAIADGSRALGTGHKLLFGDELLVDGASGAVGSYLVPRVERMPS